MLIRSFLSRFGPHAVFSKTGRPGYRNTLKGTKTLNINTFYWPDRTNIDFKETGNAEVRHMTWEGEVLEFKEAMMQPGEL